MAATLISRKSLRNDPAKLGALDDTGRLRVMPASFYEQFSNDELLAFGVLHGLYSLPTDELALWLRSVVGGLSMLEVGAGNGTLAQAIEIRATDNCMQTWPEVVAHYDLIKQAPVTYGRNVEVLDAHEAVARYQPDVVLACWVTHRFRESEPERGGNMFGVDEEAVLAACRTYIHVGNSKVHAKKSIRSVPHRSYRFPWLVARAMQPELNEICIWGARLPGEHP
jgi:hypothetical protein